MDIDRASNINKGRKQVILSWSFLWLLHSKAISQGDGLKLEAEISGFQPGILLEEEQQ